MRANIRCEKRVDFCVYAAENRRVERLVTSYLSSPGEEKEKEEDQEEED